MPGYYYVWPPPLATTTIYVYAYYSRVEISRIDRFRAYLEGSIRGRPTRDLPSRTPIIELQKFTIAREVAGEVARGTVQGPRGHGSYAHLVWDRRGRPKPASGINKRDFRSEPRGQFPICRHR